MADPDLELRGVGGGGLIYLPCWLFSLLSFLHFFPKIRGGGGVGGPLRAPPPVPPLSCYFTD